MLCLLVLLFTSLQMAIAAESPAKKEWILGISRFSQISSEQMSGLSDLELSLAELSKLALADKDGALSVSLPSLLLAKLSPLPPRFDAATAGASTPVSLWGKSDSGSLVDLKTLKSGPDDQANPKTADEEKLLLWQVSALTPLDGLLSGLYSLHGSSLEVRILFYEKGQALPVGSKRYIGDISSLESFPGTVLPGFLSLVSQRPLGIIDIVTRPQGSSLTETDKSEDASKKGHIVDKSRIFLFDGAKFPVSVSKNGYENATVTIDAAEALGTYKELRLELTPLAGRGSAAAEWASGSPESLDWKAKQDFKQKEQKFHAALGRFIVSIPFSTISAGTFFLYSEAYSRSAASSGAYYTSGAVMALCISATAGFVIDMAIKLVQTLNASR